MKDAYWFKHDATAHTDRKIRVLIKNYGWQGYGWFWLIIESLRSEDNYHLPYDELTIDALSSDMGLDTDLVKDFLDYLVKIKLLSLNGDNSLFSHRLANDMAIKDIKTQVARDAALQRWHKDDATPDTKPPF